MKLTVVIVNYNVEHFLEQCLKSVEKAIQSLPTEVYVVDNNSVDGSCEMVKQRFPWVKLIESKENLGFSKGNNLAMRKAKGEYVLLLNPDTLVEEDTFEKVVGFMDEHPDAGGLGVKMVDGKGVFLPESKRGLPTPEVAFYKIFGLSSLFPKSKKFGKYHLSYLDMNETHEVEILSGAFMLMRKETLDKVGLLDEQYFMYGEDIDLSYRIIKGGYKNYYFADTRIIHYKGESTKKGSLNYVKVFYKAMIIFAKTHFSGQHARSFIFLINLAVYLRASIAITKRLFQRTIQPLMDFVLILIALLFVTSYWEKYHRYVEGGMYPDVFTQVVIPIYILFWISGIYLHGGYDNKPKLSSIVKGSLIGSVALFTAYGFTPEEYRFSRAIMALGAGFAVALPVVRSVVFQWFKTGKLSIGGNVSKRVLIVGSKDENERVQRILNGVNLSPSFIGTVVVSEDEKDNATLGHIGQLDEVIRIYQIDEVIFCAKDVSAEKIIDKMTLKGNVPIEYKIAPPESLFIIGSNSIHTNGELYTVDINAINNPSNQRSKRLFDLIVCLLMVPLFPVLLFLNKKPHYLFFNWVEVLISKKSWVGYDKKLSDKGYLPSIKSGILSPTDNYPNENLEESTIKQLNILYAKDYQVGNDWEILWRGKSQLSRL